jgi:hypothetical protein
VLLTSENSSTTQLGSLRSHYERMFHTRSHEITLSTPLHSPVAETVRIESIRAERALCIRTFHLKRTRRRRGFIIRNKKRAGPRPDSGTVTVTRRQGQPSHRPMHRPRASILVTPDSTLLSRLPSASRPVSRCASRRRAGLQTGPCYPVRLETQGIAEPARHTPAARPSRHRPRPLSRSSVMRRSRRRACGSHINVLSE